MIGSAYFRRPWDSSDPTSGFPTPKNPHPKILSRSHYQAEVAQKRHPSWNRVTAKCAQKDLPNRQLLNPASYSVKDGSNRFLGKFRGLDMASESTSDARGAR